MSPKPIHFVLLTLVLILLWFVLSGYGFKQPIVTFGLIGIGFALFLSLRMKLIDEESAPFASLFAFLKYWVWLGGEIFKANIAVVKMALSADLNIKPVMTRAPVGLKTNLSRVTYANSITLTPGTVTVEIEDTGFIIHALDESFADQDAFGEMEKRSAKATGERR